MYVKPDPNETTAEGQPADGNPGTPTPPPPPSYDTANLYSDLLHQLTEINEQAKEEPQGEPAPAPAPAVYAGRWAGEINGLLSMGFGNTELLAALLDWNNGSVASVVQDIVNLTPAARADKPRPDAGSNTNASANASSSNPRPSGRCGTRSSSSDGGNCPKKCCVVVGILLFTVLFGLKPLIVFLLGLGVMTAMGISPKRNRKTAAAIVVASVCRCCCLFFPLIGVALLVRALGTPPCGSFKAGGTGWAQTWGSPGNGCGDWSAPCGGFKRDGTGWIQQKMTQCGRCCGGEWTSPCDGQNGNAHAKQD